MRASLTPRISSSSRVIGLMAFAIASQVSSASISSSLRFSERDMSVWRIVGRASKCSVKRLRRGGDVCSMLASGGGSTLRKGGGSQDLEEEG